MLQKHRTPTRPYRFVLLPAVVLLCLVGCAVTTVETTKASLGRPVTEAEMLRALSQPGPIRFTKEIAGTWQVPLSGLLNLDHPKAKSAGLEDRDEPIEIYVYGLQHPTAGSFIVDSGLAESFREPKTDRSLSAIVKSVMNTNTLVTRTTTREFMRALNGIDGVFLTHLHIDHILGLLDIPSAVPVYVGPGDAQLSSFTHLFTQGSTDRLLGNVDQLHEWQFVDTQFLDLFGDGSLFAILAPGHTPGTVVYLANTTTGWQLMIGDLTHIRWGWQNTVEPGTYSHDQKASAASLGFIKRLAAKLPGVHVHPGHQSLPPAA